MVRTEGLPLLRGTFRGDKGKGVSEEVDVSEDLRLCSGKGILQKDSMVLGCL